MKLWQKGEDINELFERFTIGQDQELDLYLAAYDVQGCIAHARMLGKIGILTELEVSGLVNELEVIGEVIAHGDFKIEAGIEDVHSQIELMLTQKLGDLGKKIHTGRSRNDQVLTALKLFARAELRQVADRMIFLFDTLLTKSEQYKNVLMPGYTHMQIAMPSSFGLWFGAYAESLVDDMIMLKSAHQITNKNPLGSAAGYGSSFPVDRDFTTEDLSFQEPNHNVVYAQMTRGKMEKSVAMAISSIAGTLGKLAMDICMFSGQNFDFFKVPVQFTTGSSIMPHKHNPDGFELLRGKANQLQALPYELTLITNNLPSGYHRDLQQLKERFIPAFDQVKDCLDMASLMLKDIAVADGIVDDPKYDLIFSVELVNELVQDGTPFRDAYQQVGKLIAEGKYDPPKKLNHTHLGSIGNLGNDRIRQSFMNEFAYFERVG
ncbi:MAG: argininosuccinate lyase [Cytophagales bacterium]|nr:argininosuccinate lyase [Cytophagales bacterium]